MHHAEKRIILKQEEKQKFADDTVGIRGVCKYRVAREMSDSPLRSPNTSVCQRPRRRLVTVDSTAILRHAEPWEHRDHDRPARVAARNT
jgi:hypothetical protein